MEIPKATELEKLVFNIYNEKDFPAIALEVYQFQFLHNNLYRDYCTTINRTPDSVHRMEEIPFLPISFYKTHRIATTAFDPELVFTSSGTTGSETSIHLIKKAALYRESFLQAFKIFYGDPADFCILGLLPSYLERKQSSLVYMVQELISLSRDPNSGFYLHEHQQLAGKLHMLEKKGRKTLLIGVSYALLDFGMRYPQRLNHTIVMETGGMKGRRKEMTRDALYDELKKSFGLETIHSEYGMTELLSQAYAINGLFKPAPTMKIFLRDETDPFSLYDSGSGVINVVDLANLYSCSFIATEDMGRVSSGAGFEVMGRIDHSDIRGCSLMML